MEIKDEAISVAPRVGARPSSPRYELKFLIPDSHYPAILEYLRQFMGFDRPTRRAAGGFYDVFSLYFDSPGLLALRQKLDGDAFRRKFRFRFYRYPTTDLFIEVKSRRRSVSLKERLPVRLSPHRIGEFLDGRVPLSNGVPERVQCENAFFYYRHLLHLRPVVWIAYKRRAFVGLHAPNVRVTIDRSLRGSRFRNFDFQRGSLEPFELQDLRRASILEAKFSGTVPYWLDRMLMRLSGMRMPLSKYRMAHAYLFPGRQPEPLG